jgi:hypothetical protein
LAALPEAVAGADFAELVELDSPLLAAFVSDFVSVLVSLPDFFSAGADSDAEPLPASDPDAPPDSDLELVLLGA